MNYSMCSKCNIFKNNRLPIGVIQKIFIENINIITMKGKNLISFSLTTIIHDILVSVKKKEVFVCL